MSIIKNKFNLILYSVFLLFSFLFYDYFKSPENFTGFKLSLDIISVLTLIVTIVSFIGFLLNFKNITFNLQQIIVLSIFFGTWAISVFFYQLLTPPDYLIVENSGYMWEGYAAEIVKIIKYFFGFIVVPIYFSKSITLSKLAKLFVVAASIHTIYAVHQMAYYFGVWPVNLLPINVGWTVETGFNYVYGRASGLLANTFPFGVFLQIASIFLYFFYVSTKLRVWLFFSALFFMVSLLSLSKSLFIGWIVVFVSYLLLFVQNKKKFLIGSLYATVILIIIVFFVWTQTDIIQKRFSDLASYSIRYTNNLNALKAFIGSPFVGYGIGNRFVTDNTYTSLLLEGGLVRLGGYLIFWLWLLYRVYNIYAKVNAAEIRNIAKGCIIFLISFFVQSFMIGTVERMPVILAFLSIFYVLNNYYLDAESRGHNESKEN